MQNCVISGEDLTSPYLKTFNLREDQHQQSHIQTLYLRRKDFLPDEN